MSTATLIEGPGTTTHPGDSQAGEPEPTTAEFIGKDGVSLGKVELDTNPDPEKNGELFGGSQFETESIYIDEQRADGLVIAFGGSVKIGGDDEAPDASAVALFEALRLGKSVNLTLEVPGENPVQLSARVAAKNGTWKEDAEGVTTVTGKATVKVNSLFFG